MSCLLRFDESPYFRIMNCRVICSAQPVYHYRMNKSDNFFLLERPAADQVFLFQGSPIQKKRKKALQGNRPFVSVSHIQSLRHLSAINQFSAPYFFQEAFSSSSKVFSQ